MTPEEAEISYNEHMGIKFNSALMLGYSIILIGEENGNIFTDTTNGIYNGCNNGNSRSLDRLDLQMEVQRNEGQSQRRNSEKGSCGVRTCNCKKES